MDMHITDIKTGDRLMFGSYRKEPVSWIVLDRRDGNALVVSERILDCCRYNEKLAPVTWETCTLRERLNTVFLREAFSSEERSRIIPAAVRNPRNGNDTQDRVFILSTEEVGRYFDSYGKRKCSATRFAASRGSTGWWWLRTAGFNRHHAARVDGSGAFDEEGHFVTDAIGIRPAMWLKLDMEEADHVI